MTSTNQKYRALFLSALMVLSVAAVTISFSGGVAANHATTDGTLNDGGTYWQGETLLFSHASITQGSTYQIRTNNEANRLIRERTAEQANHVVIDTSNLDGNYNLTWTSGPTGNVTQFEVVVQDFNTTFNETSVSIGDVAGLEVDSARGTFNVTATASGLDESEMNTIFAAANPINDSEDVDGAIEFTLNGGDTLEANFTGIDPGEYEFDFEVTDTDATASASINVSELDVTQDFDQNVYEEEAGDVAEISVQLDDTTSTWIVIGGDSSGWMGAVHVEDDDEDGSVSVTFNTYLAGQGSNLANVFDTEDDQILDTANATEMESSWNADSNWDIEVSTNLSVPIEAGDYDLRTTSSASIADDGGLTTENDVATLILNERSTTGATVYTAPAGSAGGDDLSELRPMLTQTDSIRNGDRVVVQFEVSGIYGYLAENDPLTALATSPAGPTQEAVLLEVYQTNPGSNRDPAVVRLTASDTDAEVLVDSANNSFYLVLNTAQINATERSVTFGQEWEALLTIGSENTSREYANYVEDDAEETAAGAFSLEQTTGDFDNVNADDQVQVLQSEDSVVSGTTNVAPGTEVSIRLRASGDSPFLKTQTVEVGENGTFSATFDMGDVAVGQEFTATARTAGGTTLADMDAIMVSEIEDPSEERTVVITRTVDTPTPRVETQVVTREVTHEVTVVRTVEVTQTTGQPGFGIAVAIVALLAAALLAVRRRD